MQSKKRLYRLLIFAAAIMAIAVIYAVTTSESAVGRRFAKVAAYRWDFRYWPNWYSAILWPLSFGFVSAVLVCREPFRGVVVRILQRVIPKKVAEAPTKYSLYFVAFFYAVLIGGILCWLFVDMKPFWRFLRYKIYADYFQDPVILLLETGQFSAKLLTWPIFLVVILGLYYLAKKRGKKSLLIFLLIFPSLSVCASAAEPADNHGETSGKIRLLQPAEYKIEGELQTISARPSEKNPDGGYNADVSILQCFAVMSYSYTGGRYHNEEILFRMRFPPRLESGKRYPLLVWLHGYGESTGDNERHLAHLHHAIASFTGKDALDFFMIAVQCPPDNANWQNSISLEDSKGDSRLVIVSEIMEAVVREYPVDENRIGVIGISSGATATWDFVELNAGKIAGLVAFSGTPAGSLSPESFQKTSIWAFNNIGDVGASWERTSDFIDAINASGGNGYVTLRRHGIHDSWSFPLKSKSVIGWLVSQTLDGEGLVQDVPYPKRSFSTIFLLFLLPISIIAASTVWLVFQPDQKEQRGGVEEEEEESYDLDDVFD